MDSWGSLEMTEKSMALPKGWNNIPLSSEVMGFLSTGDGGHFVGSRWFNSNVLGLKPTVLKQLDPAFFS